MEAFIDDDNCSIVSSGSTSSTRSRTDSNEKTTCPVCKAAFQNKNIFNHLYVKHEDEFLQHTELKYIEEVLMKDRPLRIFWTIGDTGEELELYGCLSTKKCFFTLDRAARHFKKSPEALKDHKAEAKKIMKKLEKLQKKVRYADIKPIQAHQAMFKKFREENDQDFCKRHIRLALYLRNIYTELLPIFEQHIGEWRDHWSMLYGPKYQNLHKKNITEFCNKASNELEIVIADKVINFWAIYRIVNCYLACLEGMYSLLKTSEAKVEQKQLFFMEIEDPCMPPCPF